MKSKTFLATGLTAMTLLSAFPTMTVFAESPSDSAFIPSVNMENVSPRYRYIQSARYRYIQSATISVHPNKSETIYILDIRGTSAVNSISGTATLYKEDASGNYVKIDSEKLSFQGGTVDYTGHLASSGSGNYKIEFVGTIYTSSGNESVTFRNFGSY